MNSSQNQGARLEVFYIVIALESKIVADKAFINKNFKEFTLNLLKNLPKQGRITLSYDGGQYMYINEDSDGLVYLMLAEKGFKKQTAFTLLDQCRRQFKEMFSMKEIQQSKAYGLTDAFDRDLMALKEVYGEDSRDKVDQVQDQIDGLKDTVQENLENMNKRNDKLNQFEDRTETIGLQTRLIKKQSKQVKKEVIWRSMKVKIFFGVLVVVLLWLLLSLGCGFDFHRCT